LVSSTRLSFAATLALVLGLVFIPKTAHAETDIGGDLDLVLPLHEHVDTSWGFSLRLGREIHVPFAVVTPELAFSYDKFPGVLGSFYEPKAGLRLGFGELFRPGVYGHIGAGEISPKITENHWGLAYDVGAALDFTLLPLLNLGAHVAYNHADSGDLPAGTYKWLTLGVHADLVF
jgi:hypothetical protein